MSERGSWITEYVNCDRCYYALRGYLADKTIQQFPPMTSDSGNQCLPILGGKISGLYAMEEIHLMEAEMKGLKNVLCHPVRIVVLADNGTALLIVGGGIAKTFWTDDWQLDCLSDDLVLKRIPE